MDLRSVQERMDKRTWLDFMDVGPETVGVDVKIKPSRFLAYPDEESISLSVRAFLWRAGIACEKAVPVGVGATTGAPGVGIPEAVFENMKLIGLTVTIGKFLLGWHTRVAARKRRHMLPHAIVTLLADHIEPRLCGPDEWQDMASSLVLLLPELQRELEEAFPTCCIQFEFRARGKNITRFTLRAGEGLPVNDSHVLQMIKHLDRDLPSLTLFHVEGWFAFPKVVSVEGVVRPLNLPPATPLVVGQPETATGAGRAG